MKRLLLPLSMFVCLLLTSCANPHIGASSQRTVSSKVSSVGVLASDRVFPTNVTFETKAEVVGNHSIAGVGGSQTDYYAQSFKALSDYIVNGGLWLHNRTGAATPNFRLLLCNKTASGWPNIANPLAISPVVSNTTINARPGRFYLNLTTPLHVQQNDTYWLVIDGYHDQSSTGSASSLERVDNPYPDGSFAFSNDNGTTWSKWLAHDLDFVVYFSNRPNKIEVFGTDTVASVGGQAGSDYYAQSFKALDSYITDAGVWIERFLEPTPDFRVQIWGRNASEYPDKNNVIASSRVIRGNEINGTAGKRFFVHPAVSIPVTVGKTYWLIIDGHYDQNTTGRSKSRWTVNTTYGDGHFLFSNNAGATWQGIFMDYDLDFTVTFSSRRPTIQVDGDYAWVSIGGTGYWNYAGQSFKALNKYILNAGVWLQNNTKNCPDIRILLCNPTPGEDPNVTHPIAVSIPILGKQINTTQPGWYYLSPPKPVLVVPGQIYYLIIDGWYGNTTAGNVRTYERRDNPYLDGRDCGSHNGGASWNYWNSDDLEMDIEFSDVPDKAECGSTNYVYGVGGHAVTPYFAQGFIALNDYIADAGVWLSPRDTPTPNLRLLLCENDATGYDHPNMSSIFASTAVINGSMIEANPGLYYAKPSVPIPVKKDQKYWVVIDGSVDNVTSGQAQSHAVNYDYYPDGEFLWAYANLSKGWHSGIPYDAYDLDFEVIFTHVNKPPTEPEVGISPQRPYDSDDLTTSFISSFDLEQELITYYIEWFNDSAPQPAWTGNMTIPNRATLPTEKWMVKVTPNDGHMNGTAGIYTVMVQADIQTTEHTLIVFNQTFHVFSTSNTTITGFILNLTQGKITFTATGPTGYKGFCNITIPKSLMDMPWIVKVNRLAVIPVIVDNSTHTIIHVNYGTSSIQIEIQGQMIVPEFTPTMLMMAIAVGTLAIFAVKKKIHLKTLNASNDFFLPRRHSQPFNPKK